MENENYKLKKSDFIPVKGWIDYMLRNPCNYETKERAAIIGIYNTILLTGLFGGLITTTLKTLESFIE